MPRGFEHLEQMPREAKSRDVRRGPYTFSARAFCCGLVGNQHLNESSFSPRAFSLQLHVGRKYHARPYWLCQNQTVTFVMCPFGHK